MAPCRVSGYRWRRRLVSPLPFCRAEFRHVPEAARCMIVICGAAELKGLTMRFLLATPILLLFLGNAQDETSRSVAGGGISVPGWKGTVDPNEAKTGKTINDAKFAKEGAGL